MSGYHMGSGESDNTIVVVMLVILGIIAYTSYQDYKVNGAINKENISGAVDDVL